MFICAVASIRQMHMHMQESQQGHRVYTFRLTPDGNFRRTAEMLSLEFSAKSNRARYRQCS